MDQTDPGRAFADFHANHKRFESAVGSHVLIVPHSRIYDLPHRTAERFDAADADVASLVESLSRAAAGEADLDRRAAPAPQSLSLNVSSSCNLRCSYCYASQGRFGSARATPMTFSVARDAVDALLDGADRHAPVTIGFLGGEPFANRPLIHRVVEYASDVGERRGLDVRFSVTTNGTLLEPEDIALLRSRTFAVTVSVDGGAQEHDRQRPDATGRRGFEDIVRRIAPLVERPGRARLCARATVVAGTRDLGARLEAIAAAGFDDIGFAPVRHAEVSGVAFGDADWPAYLHALTDAARIELARAERGRNIRLANFATALKQLHRGAASPYPCGAGGGYFSVAADGDWYTCHRAIGQDAFRVGRSGALDEVRRREFLRIRHVHAQGGACTTCWARYLCSGGCHQEAPARGLASCDFVRGWLSFCLSAYCELSARRPDWFAAAA